VFFGGFGGFGGFQGFGGDTPPGDLLGILPPKSRISALLGR
jgi:hypothetical protein